MVSATSRLRMWAYCLVLAALAFVQEPGRVVADTKFDLVADPVGFLGRAAQLWDPQAAFGQIQNQAYGYFWPMGPFFALGKMLGLEAWVVQRLWWALLLCLAFVGTVKVARALGIGAPWTQVVSGFAFALSAHVLTLLGPSSVEAWPSAWAPWVLLPLVNASRGGSVRRGAALSALAIAMCGGVNATAVSAVLPLGVLWVLTREGGLRLRLFSWWVLFTVLATLWWLGPLFLVGRYTVPFLDYIENAPITTLPTSLPDTLGGTSDWVAYIASEDWLAGNLLATTPFLLVNAAVVAGAGLAGVVHRDNPERAFLFLGVIAGVVLVGFGYSGPLHGWWAEERLALLDAQLAPFRNLHKYDVVLRLSLVLGLAHFLTLMAESARSSVGKVPQRVAIMGAVVSVVGMAVPAYAGALSPRGSFDAVPDYWEEAAGYLAEAGAGTTLAIPASGFGDYLWGSPHDDVLQPFASSPWGVRNIIPLAQPGNVRFLDAVSQAVEEGRPSLTLADFLASNGVGHLLVRNDLSPARSGRPDPVVLHQVLDRSPGIAKVAEFGPPVGARAVSYRNGVRLLSSRGRDAPYAAVEVYSVAGGAEQVSAWTAESVPVVAGDPASGLTNDDVAVLDGPTVLAGDRTAPFRDSPTVLTDGLRRREMSFTSVRYNESATMSPRDPWTLRSVVPNHRIYGDQERFETQVRWVGVAHVDASSAQSDASAVPPVRRDRSPAAAIDGAKQTQWVSTGLAGAVGQWWRVELARPADLRRVTITAGRTTGSPVTRLRITTEAGSELVDAPPEGGSSTYALPEGSTRSLRIRAVQVRDGGPGVYFSLREVTLPGIEAERFLATPDVFAAAPDHILLGREPQRPACAVVRETTACDDFWVLFGEERSGLRRLVRLRESADYEVRLTATPRGARPAAERFSRALPVQVETSRPLSAAVSASGLAAVDGDPDTAWIASPGGAPFLRLRWERSTELEEISFDQSAGVPGSAPDTVALAADNQLRVVPLKDGRGRFRRLVTDEVLIRFPSVEQAYSLEQGQAVRLPVSVGEVRFPGSRVPSVDPSRSLSLPCGSGPRLSVDGETLRSRVTASLSMVLSGDPLPVVSCGDDEVTLASGANLVRVLRSPLARPDALHLTRTTASTATTPQQVAVGTQRWTPSVRTVRLPERDEPTLLVVNENLNAGWVARLAGDTLRPQRVNGWMQGWLVPPGKQGQVVLRFEANPVYHWALVLGLLGVVVVVASAALPGRRSELRVGASSGATRWVLAAGLVAGGVLAGWLGFAAMAVAVTLGTLVRLPPWQAYAAGASVALAGLAQALARADDFSFHSQRAQSLALLGLVLAVGAFGAKGPEFFRRRTGRSRR